MARTTTKPDEKRKHPRVPSKITLVIHAKGLPVSRVNGKILDLSVGGMAFESDAVLEEGMSLFFKINWPLTIRGEVRSIRDTAARTRRYGVRFHKIGSVPKGSQPESFIAAQFRKA